MRCAVMRCAVTHGPVDQTVSKRGANSFNFMARSSAALPPRGAVEVVVDSINSDRSGVVSHHCGQSLVSGHWSVMSGQ